MRYFVPLVWSFGLAVLLSVPFASNSMAGQCLEDTRKVQLDGENAVKLRNYLCSFDQSGAQLGVEFHRLSDVMASALLAKTLPTSIKRVFGDGVIVKNEVHQEFSLLLKKFGNTLENMQINYQVDAAGSKEPAFGYETGTAGAGTMSLEFGSTVDLPFVEDIRHIHRKTSWPSGYKFSYGTLEKSSPKNSAIVRGTTLWRYLTQDDLESFDQKWRGYTSLIKKDIKHPKHEFGEWVFKIPNYIKLLKHVTRDNLPKKFMTITGGIPLSCGEADPYGEFSLYTRPILLDVAVVRNRSNKTLSIDRFLGGKNDKMALRTMSSSRKLSQKTPTALGGSYKIKAGGALIVPLKIIFGKTDYEFCVDKACKKAERQSYKHIRSFSKNTRFKAGHISKLSNSFKKPKLPRTPNGKKFVYGPEIALAGFNIAGEQIILKSRSANFVQLTAGAGVGSCPYLYALNEQTGRWQNYGKVIHQADSKSKKMMQVVKLNGFARHFRMTEHELELSYIDRVQLVLDLHDGRKVNLQPDSKSLGHSDGEVQKIYAGQTVEFSFELPDDIAEKEVQSSSLAITGYYRRYGSMIMSAR